MRGALIFVEDRYWVPSKAILPQGDEADAADECESVTAKNAPRRKEIIFNRLRKFMR